MRERDLVSKMSLMAEGACIFEQQWVKVCEQCRDTFVPYLEWSGTPSEVKLPHARLR